MGHVFPLRVTPHIHTKLLPKTLAHRNPFYKYGHAYTETR